MSDDIAIRVENVSKTFKLPHEKHGSIKSALINLRRAKRGYEKQVVLDDISFEIKKGEFFGVVGRNGSGKSTLLKLLAGIYTPDKGGIAVNGKLTPFIELGVGFNQELSGRDNVFLNGALLGFSRKQMERMYDEIVEFAELERFMDQKLKNYSSGMQVRLAFSIAIRANSDILVLDEVLAVGDEAFQRKCKLYFTELKKQKKTVILVTHNMGDVREYCNKAIMLRNGKIVSSGSPSDIANEYSLENVEPGTGGDQERKHNSPINDLGVEVLSGKVFDQNDKIKIKISYSVSSQIATKLRISLHDVDKNVPLFASSSPIFHGDKVSTILSAKISSINDSNMRLSVSVRDENNDIVDFLPEATSPIISLKRTDYSDSATKRAWAVLFDRGEWK